MPLLESFEVQAARSSVNSIDYAVSQTKLLYREYCTVMATIGLDVFPATSDTSPALKQIFF